MAGEHGTGGVLSLSVLVDDAPTSYCHARVKASDVLFMYSGEPEIILLPAAIARDRSNTVSSVGSGGSLRLLSWRGDSRDRLFQLYCASRF